MGILRSFTEILQELSGFTWCLVMLSDITLQYGKAVRNINLIIFLVASCEFYHGLSPCCCCSVGTHNRGLLTHQGITKNFKRTLFELLVPPATQCLQEQWKGGLLRFTHMQSARAVWTEQPFTFSWNKRFQPLLSPQAIQLRGREEKCSSLGVPHYTSLILTTDTVVWVGREKPLKADHRQWLQTSFLWRQANDVCSQRALSQGNRDTGKMAGLPQGTAVTPGDDKTSGTLQKRWLCVTSPF